MNRGYFLSVLLIIFSISVVFAVNLRRIIRAIEKQEFEKAIEWINEELEEEKYNPGVYLLYAQILSVDSLQYYDLDKARSYIDIAINQYDSASEEVKEDLQKVAIYEFTIDNTYDDIKQQTFDILSDSNTLAAYKHFISLYPDSEQVYLAVERRDSIAFERAKEIHTWTGYRDYFSTYPNSRYAPIAEVRYERMVYKDMTVSNTISSLTNFIEKYPRSPYRDEAISRLFVQKLNTYTYDNYLSFISQYPESTASQRALNVIYHMNKKEFFDNRLVSGYNRKDSLIKSYNENGQQLIAFLDQGNVGLLYPDGGIFMPARYQRIINENVFCETFTADVIGYTQGDSSLLTNRSGEIFYSGQFSSLVEDSTGLVWIDQKGGTLLHKDGTVLYTAVDDFEPLDNKWIILKRRDRFALASYSGNLLSKFIFSSIHQEGDFFVFTRGSEEIAIYTRESLLRDAEDGSVNPSYRFDDVEFVSNEIIIGFNDNKECLLDKDLAFLIPWGMHEVYPDPEIYYTRIEGTYRLYNRKYTEALGTNTFNQLVNSEVWLAVKNDFWKVVNLQKDELLFKQFDTVRLLNDQVLFSAAGDDRTLHFANGETVSIEQDESFYNLPSEQDSVVYIAAEYRKNKKLYDQYGQFLFSSTADQLLHLRDTIFKVTEGKRNGVISTSGEQILSTKYDLVQVKGDQLFTLIDGEIGNYDLESGIAFDADYEAAFDKQSGYYITRLNSKYGVLDQESESVLPFEYNDVEVLNDSLIWAETDTAWLMLTAYENRVLLDDVKSFRPIDKDRKSFMLFTRQGYGVMAADGKFIVNPVFSDIRLLTAGGRRIFRAEKYFQEAGYYILVWYNHEGKKIYSNAYRKEEYELLYCE